MSEATTRPLRIAIIGAGPSGFFAADTLLKQDLELSMDILDRLPTPFGLVRYGVAPDHQKIKSVRKLYEKICEDSRVRFLGNVGFGEALSHADVHRFYDAVIYAVGASSDRSLGLTGEDLPGSHSATEFVAWYNAHPDYATKTDLMKRNLEAETVAVIGMGNVAVDVTRILAKSVDELARTDIADHALEALEHSRVKDIYMLGRRGPAQGKFTTKELRELGELANADIDVREEELELDPASQKAAEKTPMIAKNIEVLRDFAKRPKEGKPRCIHLRFFVSPKEILGSDRVSGIVLERNRLEKTDSGYLNAVGTGELETLEGQLLLRSVGYRGMPLADVPFDPKRYVIPNRKGRVLDEHGQVKAGEYVAGWIKRGPTGVIGTNKVDAAETVESLVADAPSLPRVADEDADPEAVTRTLEARNVAYVTFEGWLELSRYELEAGKRLQRPRVKVATLKEMLERCKNVVASARSQTP